MASTLDNTLYYTTIGRGLHIVLKPLYFFPPYPQRLSNLNKSYGTARSSSLAARGDSAALAAIVCLTGIIVRQSSIQQNTKDKAFVAQIFVHGIWIGATLTQIFFHRFTGLIPTDSTDNRKGLTGGPKGDNLPLKAMSYAIQEDPTRGTLELVLLMGIASWAVFETLMV